MALPNPSMTFTPFDVLPASDLNDLVENIESLADGTGLDSTFYDNAGIWWEELGRTTLGVAGDTITVNSIPATKYLKILYSLAATGGDIIGALRFNNDSGTNYGSSLVTNGSYGSSPSQTSIVAAVDDTTTPRMGEGTIVNIATREKMLCLTALSQGASGAGNVPQVRQIFGKWTNASNQITRIDLINFSSGDFAIGSELVVLGHN
jgi:hypothetical protein